MSYEDYLPSAPKYEFKGVQDYQRIMDQQVDQNGECRGSEYTIFTMDERSFHVFFLNTEESLLKCWESYDPSTNELLVRMPTTVHEVATTQFQSILQSWIQQGDGNGNYPVMCTLGASVRGTTGKTKRPDCSWVPAHTGLSTHYPSIIVEVAWTETRKKLENDMQWWLTKTDGQVNVVLSVTVQRRGKIIVEEWGIKRNSVVPVQTMQIVRKPASNDQKVEGHLSLNFEDIHRRQKTQGNTDFVLTPDGLERMAKGIWIAQDRKLDSGV